MSVAAAALPWADRWRHHRDALLASPHFQRWAAAFPLTRFIARRRAAALFDLVAGFAYSQVLLACVRLDLFEMLFENPLTLEAIAQRCALPTAAAQRLLDAAVSLRLLERRSGQRYGLGALGAPMVGQRAIKAMVEHHGAFYADLADPVALLRGRGGGTAQDTALSRQWRYAGHAQPHKLGDDEVAGYSALMSDSQALVADEILRAHDWRSHHCLLDVGGGAGTFLATALQREPHLRGILFDLPAVVRRGAALADDPQLGPRITRCGGDFLRDPLPRGADIATLVRVVHDHDDAAVLGLLRAVRDALPPGGTLLIAEPMAGAPGAARMGDAYFGLYLLAMGQGRARTPRALEALLHAAGFVHMRLLRTALPLQVQVMSARRGSV